MPAINVSDPTLLDVAKTMDPSGRFARIVNLMRQRSPIVEDAVWMAGDLPTGKRVTSVTGLPSPTWTGINRGVATSKAENSQYDEACGMLESASQIDARLRRIHGANFAAYRAQQDELHKLAMLQELETGVLYHSTGTDPRRLNGFTPRYDSTTRPSGGSQVIRCDAAASGADQTSAWLIKWAEDACYMIYPPSSMGGIKSEDMGLVDVRDASGLTYPAFKTYHSWEPGLVIEDYRQVCRVCNIDTGSLAANGSNIIEAMIRAYHQIQNPNGGRLRWYVNRTVATFLHLQSRAGGINNPAVVTQYEGRPMLTFLEIPVRVTDSILTTEAVVS